MWGFSLAKFGNANNCHSIFLQEPVKIKLLLNQVQCAGGFNSVVSTQKRQKVEGPLSISLYSKGGTGQISTGGVACGKS